MRSDALHVLGLSTVFGNVDLDTATDTLKRLLSELSSSPDRTIVSHPVYAGASRANAEQRFATPASRRLAEALTHERLTVLALGPLTNIATVISHRPDLAGRIDAIVAVAGTKPGARRLHPGGARWLHVHDLNFVLDPNAFRAVLDADVPLVLVPYDASDRVQIDRQDLERLASSAGVSRWLARASRGWFAFWTLAFGEQGFRPFDGLAVGWAVAPEHFACTRRAARIRHRPSRFTNQDSLEITPLRSGAREVLWCTDPSPAFKTRAVGSTSPDPSYSLVRKCVSVRDSGPPVSSPPLSDKMLLVGRTSKSEFESLTLRRKASARRQPVYSRYSGDMLPLIGSPGDRTRWSDLLIPNAILQQSPDDARSGRVLLTGIVSAFTICLLFALVHWSNGDVYRALVSALTCFPVAGALVLLWYSGRVLPAVHYLLGICTAIVIASPFLSREGEPALVALVIVPVAAVLMCGARAGASWSVIITLLLVAYARLFPFSDADGKVVWLTAIMAGGGGLAAVLIERGRERATRDAQASREAAELDADDRLKAENALRETQALFAIAFRRSSSLMIFVSIETGEILDVNESFVQTMGWSAEEAQGMKFSELDLWATPGDQGRLLETAISKGAMRSIEIHLRTKSGDLIWFLGSLEVLQLDDRSCLLAEGVDITTRKRTDAALARYRNELEERFAERGEQLQESREQLRQRDRMAAVGTLAAGIAHQINNPIGGIVAATEFAVVADDDTDRERIRTEALATAHDEAMRCGRIVKNILKFARDERTTKWTEDLTSTVLKAAELSRPYVSKRGGRIEMKLTSLPLEVLMSPIDIEQVILNLIHNASESKQDGAEVLVQTREQDGLAEVAISDNGDGIDPKVRSRVFEPFFTSRLAEGGTGLGLSVAHGIVTDHGGKLEIEDAPGGGTLVRVLLPLAAHGALLHGRLSQ